MAPYCTTPRDYLSDTPLLRAMGFVCLNMTNSVSYPFPVFWAFPLGEHAKWTCEVDVRLRAPPTKGVSQSYLRDITWKQLKIGAIPPLRFYLEKTLRDMGGGV